MTTRQLRDHFDLMHKNRQKERKAEVRLSGIAVPEDELNEILDEISEDMEGCNNEQAEISEAKGGRCERKKSGGRHEGLRHGVARRDAETKNK